MFWSKRPFVRIILFFVAGILAWYYGSLYLSFTLVELMFVVSIVMLGFGLQVFFNRKFSLRWLIGLSVGILFFLMGMLVSQWHALPNNDWKLDDQFIVARLITDPQVKGEIVKAELKYCPDESHVAWEEKDNKILGYFERCLKTDTLQYGDVIVFNGIPAAVDGPTNPGEFNYKEYLARKSIYHSIYLREGSWKWLSREPSSIWLYMAYKARGRLQDVLSSTGLNVEEYAVASAILLGNDDLMNSDLRENYVYAGAMHILCVSGLHVGIIYLIFNYLLSFFNKNRGLRMIKALILLAVIWVYASVTGLSPSVQRAGLMVTIFIVGQLILRKKDNVNTLAASAMILLLFDPMLIFHIGFQLSYAAVAGILILYPPIYQVFYVKNFLLDKIWSITALSFAAQIATFPLAVHYFHFFPNWFWLSNLVTYPLSFLVLTGGMAFLFLSWVPVVSSLLGWMLAGLVFVLNYLVGLVKWLPYPGLVNLHLSSVEVVMIYLLIAMIFLLLSQKRWKALLPTMLLLVALLAIETVQHWQHLRQQGLVVYNLNKHSLIQVVEGRQSQVIADIFMATDPSRANFSTKAAQAYWGLTSYDVVALDDTVFHTVMTSRQSPYIFQTHGHRIMILTGNDQLFQQDQPLNLDVLIVTGKPKIVPEHILQTIQVKTIIADGSVPTFLKLKLKDMAKQSDISFHDTSKEGAYVWGLK